MGDQIKITKKKNIEKKEGDMGGEWQWEETVNVVELNIFTDLNLYALYSYFPNAGD